MGTTTARHTATNPNDKSGTQPQSKQKLIEIQLQSETAPKLYITKATTWKSRFPRFSSGASALLFRGFARQHPPAGTHQLTPTIPTIPLYQREVLDNCWLQTAAKAHPVNQQMMLRHIQPQQHHDTTQGRDNRCRLHP